MQNKYISLDNGDIICYCKCMSGIFKRKQFNKSDWYMEKNDIPFYVVLGAFSITALFMIFISVKWSNKYTKLQKEYLQLQQTHYHLWSMDKSCSDQLLSGDTLRIKVSK